MKLFNQVTSLPEDIFRAYDIRGITNQELTADVVYSIAKAIAAEALAIGQTSIVVGRDGRLSSPLFGQAVLAGLLESGIQVIDLGAVPTPLVYFATHMLMSRTGIMITGSHNPGNYNGLKIVLDGVPLAGENIKQLYHRVLAQDFCAGQGSLINVNIAPAYFERIVNDVRIRKPLKIVLDAGNGIAGKVAPILFRQLGCEVIDLYCDVDGRFPNHHPDPSQVKNLQDLIDAVRSEQADIGVAFDGDGDRLGVVTNKGTIIWPDRQLMAFAVAVLKCHPGATVLFDVKCSKYLAQTIEDHGGVPLMWKTGHSFIKNKMKEKNSVLAGEMSGHIFFKDRWYGFDDAIYAGARLLEIIADSGLDAETLFNQLPNSVNTPELQIPVTDSQKFALIEQLAKTAVFTGGTINDIDGLRVDFPSGFGLIRPSNTTPNLVLRFEADTAENLTMIQDIFRQQLESLQLEAPLPF